MPPGWVFEGSSENGRASRALVRVAPFEPLASGSSVRAVGLPQDGLAAIEGLGISCRRVGLHPAEPEDRKKGLFVEPLLLALRLEAVDDDLDLAGAGRFFQRNEEVGRAQVAVVLRDLILQDQVAPARVPREVRDQAVVLVPVVAVVGEDQIGAKLPLQGLELILDLTAEKGEEAIAEFLDHDLLLEGAVQKSIGAGPGLAGPLLVGAENDPADDHFVVALEQGQDRPAAANLDVIAVRPQA